LKEEEAEIPVSDGEVNRLLMRMAVSDNGDRSPSQFANNMLEYRVR
jgi:hypothetical protein